MQTPSTKSINKYVSNIEIPPYTQVKDENKQTPPCSTESKRSSRPSTPMHKRLTKVCVDELIQKVNRAYQSEDQDFLFQLQSHICGRIEEMGLSSGSDYDKLVDLRGKIVDYIAEVSKEIELQQKEEYIFSLPWYRQIAYRCHEYYFQTHAMTYQEVMEMGARREEQTKQEEKSSEKDLNVWREQREMH